MASNSLCLFADFYDFLILGMGLGLAIAWGWRHTLPGWVRRFCNGTWRSIHRVWKGTLIRRRSRYWNARGGDGSIVCLSCGLRACLFPIPKCTAPNPPRLRTLQRRESLSAPHPGTSPTSIAIYEIPSPAVPTTQSPVALCNGLDDFRPMRCGDSGRRLWQGWVAR